MSKPIDIAQRYDKLAADYDARWRKYNRAVYDEVSRHLPRDLGGARVLDVGCGTGAWLEWLLRRHSQIALAVGVDPSREMLNVACARFACFKSKTVVKLRQENAENFSSQNDSFDLITSLNVMHYLEKPRDFFADAQRVLDVGGTLIVQDYTRNGWPFFAPSMRVFDAGTRHIFSPRELSEMAQNAGFRVRYARTFAISVFWRGAILVATKA